MTGERSRAVAAGALIAAAVAVVMGAWLWSGWADVRMRQRELRAGPGREAAARGAALAHDLRAELAQLVAREVERPYFHYQNLFHDPRSGGVANVTPSPLASGPREALVAGYFQVDPRGRLSTPPINDELPSLSDRTRLAEHRAFLDGASGIAAALAGPPAAVVVADAQPQQQPQQQVQQQVVLDPESYAQNAAPNRTFLAQNAAVPRAPAVKAEAGAGAVMITVSALSWQTLAYAGAPALVAVRHVETPDGTLAQGFVVDRAALTGWLAARGGALDAVLVAGDRADAAEVAPGWHLVASPSPRAVAAAAVAADAVSRDFVIRFAGAGAIALLAALGVVVLVRRAERLARERSQFAAAAAHELRTPLAGLQLYGEMLADGLGDPAKQHDYARRMSEEAARLGRVVSNVLGFSQLERGNLSVDPRESDLAATLADLAQRARPALERAGVQLELAVPADLRARFDADAIARIVGNLLDNAEKYGRDAADRTVELAARATADAVEVVVADRGPGVAAAARARLFRPFTRGATGDGPAGLGLGLALSRSLARAMGGELALRPGAGGAAFVLTLPRAS